MSKLGLAEERALYIKSLAAEFGFLDCRIARAGFLDKEAPLFEQWLKSGFQADMHWIEKHLDLRLDPRRLLPGAKSVICLSYNYFPEPSKLQQEKPKMARYAMGRDYHKVIGKKLKKMMARLKQEWGDFEGRGFVDSGPVHERAWAQRSGLGWIGKNSLLLSKKQGSYFFLAVLILDVELGIDLPVSDHCGQCTRCIDACPTKAIVGDGVIDSNLCISYLTIESKAILPESLTNQLDGWAFGCDVCQEVCPWNRFSKPHQEPDFLPHPEIESMHVLDWLNLTEVLFEERLGRTPLKRAGFERFKKNVANTLREL